MKYSLVILALTLLSLTGCASFKNAFMSQKNEDYNAIAYGADHAAQSAKENAKESWVSQASEMSNSGSAQLSDDRGRALASASDTEKNILDPTNDRVRNEIEVGRGLAVSAYAKGDRATRADFYDSAPNDGSLWSNSNDSNYFFTKGKVRSTGDIVSVKMEPALVKNLAEEVKKSLTPAEQQVEMALYTKNSDAAKDDKDVKAYRNVASEDLSSEAGDVKDRMEKAVRWQQVDLSSAIGLAPNDELRAEVIDRYPNGNYKVRAIKKMLYRGSTKLVSFVAIAPENDFDDKDSITSGKLYDYKIKVAR